MESYPKNHINREKWIRDFFYETRLDDHSNAEYAKRILDGFFRENGLMFIEEKRKILGHIFERLKIIQWTSKQLS